MHKILPASFFDRDTLTVAQELLGKFFVRRYRGRWLVAQIVDVEAYDGPHDQASHAHRGKTSRNALMFGPAGVWYVYLIYGMYWMLNIVTGPVDYPAAILLRGVELPDGTRLDGPGKITRYFHVTKALNQAPAGRPSGAWIEDRGKPVASVSLQRGPRIGVDYAGAWARKPYRFFLP